MNEKAIIKLGPKKANHPSIGRLCPACMVRFTEGDYTVLVALGPGGDPEERAKARNNERFEAAGIEVHYACHTGIED